MKRIFIFTVGDGAREYWKHIDKEKYEILGFIDNDSNKQNQLFKSKMIYHPSILLTAEFDEIHIANIWAYKVKEQILERFDLPQEKLIEIPKGLLKGNSFPFETEALRTLSKSIISEICLHFAKLSIPLFLDAGCLLGFYRDKQFLPWDDDIDFIIKEQHVPQFETQLTQFLENCSFKDLFYFSTFKWPTHLDLRLEPKENHPDLRCFDISFTTAFHEGEMTKLYYVYIPSHFLTTVEWLDLYPGKASVPAHLDEYLSVIYGDWKTTKKEWRFGDCANK